MKTYLVNIYNSQKSEQHFISDITLGNSIDEVESFCIGKVYHRDSYKKHVLGICKKAVVVHEILQN